MIRVAVVDDQDLVRAGFVLLLRAAPNIEVVGEAGDGLGAVALCHREAPDVVLMDVRMPHLDGLAATRTILSDPACPATRILILTTFDEDEVVVEAPG
jgi:DNA-binding NarL/FixJ family response regulator